MRQGKGAGFFYPNVLGVASARILLSGVPDYGEAPRFTASAGACINMNFYYARLRSLIFNLTSYHLPMKVLVFF